MSCLYIRNGKLDTKWTSTKTKLKKENSRTALDGKFITLKHKVPTSAGLKPVYRAVVLSENVFCQDMVTVVLLNPVCNLLFGMLHVYKSGVRVAVFET